MLRSTLSALALVGLLGALALAQVATEPQPPATQPSQPATQPAATPGQPGMMTQEQKEAFGRFVKNQIARLTAFAAEFNLSQDQMNRIQNVLMRHRQEITNHMEHLWKCRIALRDAIMAENPDNQMIQQTSQKLGEAIGSFSMFAAKVKTEISPILTEQQRMALRRFVEGNDRAMQTFFSEFVGGRETPAVGAVPETTR